MSNIIFHLSTCSTCQRIIKEIGNLDGVELQDIKTHPITSDQLDEMKNLSGSYVSLFSRRAMKYKALNLKDQILTEKDYRQYILEEYTFLKRPVAIIGHEIFIGNSKKNVAALKQALQS